MSEVICLEPKQKNSIEARNVRMVAFLEQLMRDTAFRRKIENDLETNPLSVNWTASAHGEFVADLKQSLLDGQLGERMNMRELVGNVHHAAALTPKMQARYYEWLSQQCGHHPEFIALWFRLVNVASQGIHLGAQPGDRWLS